MLESCIFKSESDINHAFCQYCINKTEAECNIYSAYCNWG